jgi:hypothetical protein
MSKVWSTKGVIYFASSLAWDELGQQVLRYILSRWHGMVLLTQFEILLFPRKHRRGLVNKSRDAFCVLARMGEVWSTQIEIHFLSSLQGWGLDNRS